MLILYRFGIWFYWLTIRLISPFHSKARKFKEGRVNWKSTLTELFQDQQSDVVWYHAASLGEFEQGRPVMEALKQAKPHVKIFLTFFSPSGYEIRKNYEHADWVFYLPLDSPKNAEFLIKTVKPKLAVFIKYEFWYYYLQALGSHNIPTLMISCIFRSSQIYFKPKGKFFLPILQGIEHYFMQDENSHLLAKQIGIDQSTIAGDTRFDRVIEIAQGAKEIEIIEKFKGSERLMILGSTWPSDIQVLEAFINLNQDKVKFAIAPHNIGESDVDALLKVWPNAIKFSESENADLISSRIIIINNMGMLSSLYRYGEFAFIGGAFRGALHNTLEAAVYGIPVFFGEHEKNQKFKEAIGLVEAGGGFTFSSTDELIAKFNELLEDETEYNRMSQVSGKFVESNSGATPIIVEKMLNILG